MEQVTGQESNPHKIESFRIGYDDLPVEYGERVAVKDGVVCDTYKFVGDEKRDLAIVQVTAGSSTPPTKSLTR